MRIVYFDTIAGISGDMALGAFVSAGVPLDALIAEIQKLNLPGVEIEGRHINRSGITAVKLDVVVSKHQTHHRHLHDIFGIIEGSTLSGRVQERAKGIFNELAQAEAKIHNTTVEEVHFHEVGALDAIVDIVGTVICLEIVGAEKVYSSPVKLGHGGFVETDHGKMPIPTPATVEILKNYPTVLTDIPFELTTPTGAAIIKALSSGLLATEKIQVESIGYGAGSRELEPIPNLLRIFIGELPQMYDDDELVTVETNIDDMNPEIYPFVIEKLLATGAHDAYIVPVIMKKGRPGVLLSVLTHRAKLDDILEVVFRETTTLGVRIQHVERKKVSRSQRTVTTSLGIVNAKVISLNGNERLVPEFEECRRIAVERKMPLIEVYNTLQKELGVVISR
jgi:uncharacterized protein (TIGR00299 family) protein